MAAFNMQGLPFSLSVLTFGFLFVGLLLTHVTAYFLILRWSDAIKPAWSTYVGPAFDVLVVGIRYSVGAAMRALTSKTTAFELPGSEPGSYTIPPPHYPPTPSSQRVSSWDSISKRFRRKHTEEHELQAV